ASHCRLCRKNPERRETVRPASRATDPIRPDRQPQDSSRARPHGPTLDPLANERGDRVVRQRRKGCVRCRSSNGASRWKRGSTRTPNPNARGCYGASKRRVCHSEVHFWDGYFDLGGEQRISLESRGVHLPFTMGHEIAGEVAALGPQASGVKIGDK